MAVICRQLKQGITPYIRYQVSVDVMKPGTAVTNGSIRQEA